MISKQDIMRYIEKAESLENDMVEKYRYMLDHLNDSRFQTRLERLVQEEGAHSQRLQRLRARISEQ